MDIDIAKVEYEVELTTENGTKYPLNGALISLMWEEQENTLAQTAKITLAQMEDGSSYLAGITKLNCIIRIFGKWKGNERSLLFEGTICEWQYASSGTSRELTVTANDPIIRLQRSEDIKYFSAGLTTQAIISDIFATWKIPFDYKWDKSITHGKKVFSGTKISDMITELLNEVKQKTGARYVLYFRDGKLQIVGYGTNKDVYKFTKDNTMSTSYKVSINDLVTRVKIIGKADDDGRSPVDAVVDGDTQYGVFQAVVRRDSDKDISEARAEAAALLKEKGKPQEQITVTVPDLPFTRRGGQSGYGGG